MNAITATKPTEAVVFQPVNEASQLVNAIMTMAARPDIDIDKIERLIELQERIRTTNAKQAFYAAFSAMQDEMPEISEAGGIKDRSGKVQSTYALWEDINKAIKPILQKFGFGLSFRINQRDAFICVAGVLSHREGHAEETEIALPIDGSGSKNAVQAVGSSTSYGKRYTAMALLNITSRGEDDDGAGTDQGAAAQAVRNIDMITDMDTLNKWRSDNWDGLAKMLDGDEQARVTGAWNRKRRQILGGGNAA